MSEFSEKDRRVYYQDIVYAICNILDKHNGGCLCCGTVDEPSTEVQDALVSTLNTRATDPLLDRMAEALDDCIDMLCHCCVRLNPQHSECKSCPDTDGFRDVLAEYNARKGE